MFQNRVRREERQVRGLRKRHQRYSAEPLEEYRDSRQCPPGLRRSALAKVFRHPQPEHFKNLSTDADSAVCNYFHYMEEALPKVVEFYERFIKKPSTDASDSVP